MESLYLKTLVEVVRAGSLSRAAEALNVTQPAVSRRIKFMEDQYGCPLLDRSANRIQPTEAGRLVYQKATTLLDIEADLVAGLHRLGGRTRVSFGSTPAFGIAHLPAVVREFMLTCADRAELKFMSSTPAEMFQGLMEGVLDAAVIESCEQFDLSAFAAWALPDTEVLFVSAPAVDLPATGPTIDQLLGLPLFTRREGCCLRTLLESGLKAIRHDIREFRSLIVLDDLHALIQTVLAGDGVSFLSVDLLGEHLAAGRLRAHAIPGFPHHRKRSLVVNQPVEAVGPIPHLIAAVLAHFGLPAAADPSTPPACRTCP